jgi:uncharacterized protein YjdB
VATVSTGGLVKAISIGNVTITATTLDGNMTAICNITVNPINVTGISISPSSTSLVVNGTQQLTATISPYNATNQNVTWSSSNTAVATISTNGLVNGISVGTATITVTTEDGNKTATCEVTVNPIAVTGVSVNPTSASLVINGTQQLTATVSPSNATNQNVSWSSSNAAVATVSIGGMVKAISVGTATITVTTQDGNKTANCIVTVNPVAVTGVSVSPSSALLIINGTQQFTATVLPTNATNQNVTWSSSNTTVATVSTGGMVKAISVGTATITVTTEDGNKTATCEVTVNPIAVTGVSVNPTSASFVINGTQQLTATLSPANATNQNISWSSSNTAVATVSTGGLVKAISVGTAAITVITQDGNKTANCNITVNPIAVTGISINPASFTLFIDSTIQLIATVYPLNATNQKVIWNSTNTLIATVSDSGLVKAIYPGAVLITATTVDGNIIASCNIISVHPDQYEQAINNELLVTVFPNPSVGEINILVNSSTNEPVNLKIFDMNGVMKTEIHRIPINNSFKINLKLNSGVYVADFSQGNQRKKVKIIRLN